MLTNQKKLSRLFAFLEANHHWSKSFQEKEWEGMLGGCRSADERLNALLYSIVNTQSQPKLEPLARFWQKLHSEYRHSDNPTLSAFCRFLGRDTGKPLNDLYNGLLAHDGWGTKTAALFVKNVINIHRSDKQGLHIFRDGAEIAKSIHGNEKIYLPVDMVIACIFGLQDESVAKRFRDVNEILHEVTKGNPDHMLIWDDLWFWGFITQKGTGSKRTTEWNPPKFWAMRAHSKDDALEVEKLANRFINLLQP